MRRSLALALGTCLLPLLLVACGSPTERAVERAIEKETGGQVDVEGETTRITTSEGTVTINQNALPDDWPDDVSAYPGSTIQMAGTGVDGEQGAALQTTDSQADVVAYYKTELPKAGWKLEGSVDMPQSVILAASKNDRKLAIQVNAGEGQTTIIIGMGTDE